MHCIKTINIEHEYGAIRLFLLTGLTFILVFCFSYILINLNYNGWHTDQHFFSFVLCLVTIYPLHKCIHYFTLAKYKKSLSFRFKFDFYFVPVIKMRLQEIVPRQRYIISLLAPFFLLNSVLLIGAIALPAYSHYFCLLLSIHCSICVLDLLSFKIIWHAPKDAMVEETPRGYEILVP